jgi:hypothetical protein
VVSDADLLQANATVIAGILIFLTIRRISQRGEVNKSAEGKKVFEYLISILSIMLASMAASLFQVNIVGLSLAKILFLIGVGLIIPMLIYLRKQIPEPEW